MRFSHPLARSAKIWPMVGADDRDQKLLVIVTTLELDTSHKRYKRENVERLKTAAHEWVSFHQTESDCFVLINRPKDW